MTTRILRIGSVLALAVTLVAGVGTTRAAVDCEEALGSNNYRCTFKDEMGGAPFSVCLDFTAPGLQGELDVRIEPGYFAACICEAKGSFATPTFHAALEVLCGGTHGLGLEAKTDGGGAKLLKGTLVVNNALSYAFACQRDASCTVVPVCGDDLQDPLEQCDDGNTTGGDGCSASCTNEICGNGLVDAGEQCDDGGTTSGDGCSASCTVEAGYSCSGTPSSCTLLCGNGILNPGEECDDGNTNNFDGCSNSCTCGCPMNNALGAGIGCLDFCLDP